MLALNFQYLFVAYCVKKASDITTRLIIKIRKKKSMSVIGYEGSKSTFFQVFMIPVFEFIVIIYSYII